MKILLFFTFATIFPIVLIFFVGLLGVIDDLAWQKSITLFAASSSALAAISTSATLIFIVLQGKKQNELWEYQKHQVHKEEFFSLLNSVENETSFSFHNKAEIYKRFFPGSKLESFSNKVNESLISEIGLFIKNAEESVDEGDVGNFGVFITRIQSCLNINLSHNLSVGDVIHEDSNRVIFNMYEPEDKIKQLEDCLSRMLDFFGVDSKLSLYQTVNDKHALFFESLMSEIQSHSTGLLVVHPVKKGADQCFHMINKAILDVKKGKVTFWYLVDKFEFPSKRFIYSALEDTNKSYHLMRNILHGLLLSENDPDKKEALRNKFEPMVKYLEKLMKFD